MEAKKAMQRYAGNLRLDANNPPVADFFFPPVVGSARVGDETSETNGPLCLPSHTFEQNIFDYL